MTGGSARARLGVRLLALIVLTALLVIAARRLDLARVASELSVVRPLWIGLALLCFLSILPLWAAQWRILSPAVPRPPLRRMLGVVAMTSSVLNTTSLLVGEAAGVFFLVARAGLGRSAAVSVLAMDQLLVGMAKVVVLATAAWIVVLPVWMERGMTALTASVGLLLAGLLLAAWRTEQVARLASRHLSPRLATIATATTAALAPLRSPTRFGGAFALALTKKLVEVLAILCIQRAFGVTLPFASAILVLAALNLATLLPIVPGNAGVFEAAVVLTYSHLGIGAERALGMAVVHHALFFAALALPGYRWLARAAPTRSAAAAS